MNKDKIEKIDKKDDKETVGLLKEAEKIKTNKRNILGETINSKPKLRKYNKSINIFDRYINDRYYINLNKDKTKVLLFEPKYEFKNFKTYSQLPTSLFNLSNKEGIFDLTFGCQNKDAYFYKNTYVFGSNLKYFHKKDGKELNKDIEHFIENIINKYSISNSYEHNIEELRSLPNKKVGILFSGGFDSTYLLIKQLTETDNIIFPIINSFNKTFSGNNGDSFEYLFNIANLLTLMDLYPNRFGAVFQVAEMSFYSQINGYTQQPLNVVLSALFYNQNFNISEIQTGYISGDEAISFEDDLKKLFNLALKFNNASFFYEKKNLPKLTFPLKKHFKSSIVNNINKINNKRPDFRNLIPLTTEKKIIDDFYQVQFDNNNKLKSIDFNIIYKGDKEYNGDSIYFHLYNKTIQRMISFDCDIKGIYEVDPKTNIIGKQIKKPEDITKSDFVNKSSFINFIDIIKYRLELKEKEEMYDVES